MEKDSKTNLVLMIFKEYIFKHWEKLVSFFKITHGRTLSLQLKYI